MADQQVENMPQEETLLGALNDDVPQSEEQQQKHKQQNSLLLVPEPESVNPPTPNNISDHENNNNINTPLKSQHHNKTQDDVTKIAHLPEHEQKALQHLKQLVKDALFPNTAQEEKEEEEEKEAEEEKQNQTPTTIAKTLLLEDVDGAKTLEAIEETIVAAPPQQQQHQQKQHVSIWGVRLMEDDRTDVVLSKFLRARDFNATQAFAMLSSTLKWRKAFGVDVDDDNLMADDDDFGGELGKAVFMHGFSKQGNPVCYNVYGEFRNKELYHKLFSDEEKRNKFLKWRIRFLEKSIRKLDFSPGGVSTIVQVNDMNDSPGPNRWELRQATYQALQLLQDNYPEFVAKQVFINVPWWYLALSKMISPFMTQRTKSKFVVAGPSRSTETLLKYIAAEQIPTQYGGLCKEDGDFGVGDNVTEIIVKPSVKHIVEFPITQTCNVSWEMRVVGWEVNYGAEFVPNSEDSYTIIIQKMRRIGSTQEQVICGSYKAGELGKLVLTINNVTSKKKKLLYRFKTKLSDY